MGTNYYLHTNVCDKCGRGDETKHIGKSSGGWCFALHVYPNENINTLADWEKLWTQGEIRNEYGDVISYPEMKHIITAREWVTRRPSDMDDEWYAENHAIKGPNGLARHKIDGYHTIGHGDGTYDYCIGDFS